jgi:peptide/nickel transport system permease protein
MAVARFTSRRLVQMVPTLLLVTLVVFTLMHLAPGDPVVNMLGEGYTPQMEQALRQRLGLDQPLPIQYVTWVSHSVVGDLGTSIRTNQPVSQMIAERFSATFSLALLALILALLLAIPIGVVSAANRNSPVDYLAMAGAVLGLSVPNFVLAIVLILVLSVNVQLVPTSGYANLWEEPGKAWPLYIMPVVALALARAAVLARMMRASMLDVLHQDYIRTARAKGLRQQAVLVGHALRSSLIPVITVAAINFGHLLGGSVVIEQIFGFPGIGTMLVSAVLFRDFPVILGSTLTVAVLFLAASLLADILYSVVDPRIRYA